MGFNSGLKGLTALLVEIKSKQTLDVTIKAFLVSDSLSSSRRSLNNLRSIEGKTWVRFLSVQFNDVSC